MRAAHVRQAAGLIAIAVLLLAAQALTTVKIDEAAAKTRCQAPKILTADGCRGPGAVGKKLAGLVQNTMKAQGMKAVIARVDMAGRMLYRGALGSSQPGVPANPRMRFRVGSMIIPALTSVAFQLQDEGRLKITDPISRWLPEFPRSGETTLLMLMNNSSGLQDWVQGNDAFVDIFYADPFRRWGENELLRIALARGPACSPGSCFNYAHTNYLILGKVLRKVTGTPTATEIRRRIFRPLGMRQTRLSRLAPIPAPALHSYTTERGVFEDATSWSPSWTLGNGTVGTATIDDVSRIARGVLSGRTLSRKSRRQLARRFPPRSDEASPGLYFAQGLIVRNGWRLQNPYLNGYMGTTAWLPAKRLAISVAGTRGRGTPGTDGGEANLTDAVFTAIADYLAPGAGLK